MDEFPQQTQGPFEGFILLIRFKCVHILEAREWRKHYYFSYGEEKIKC